MSAEAERPLLYVLSAGRTGTMFLERLILTYCAGVTAAHEPGWSRSLLLLGNMRNDTGLLPGMVRRLSARHQSALHDGAAPFVEINPFLCPVTDLLPRRGRALRVVHMVRSPGDWAQSIVTFKASDRYRGIVDWVPFAKPYPAPRPPGWQGLPEFEKALHRWNWCNSRISALGDKADRYAVIRSEDLFGSDPDIRERATGSILDTLGLTSSGPISPEFMTRRVNPAPDGKGHQNPDAVRRICGDLAASFGYEL